jgi:hypothetical protein
VSVWGAVLGVLALCAGAGALIARKLNALSPPTTSQCAACAPPAHRRRVIVLGASSKVLLMPAIPGHRPQLSLRDGQLPTFYGISNHRRNTASRPLESSGISQPG